MFPTLKTAKYAFNAGRYFLNVPLQLRNRALRRSGVAGPLPLPPPRLSFLVQWVYDLECHYESGKLGYACIVDSLERNGYSPRSFKRILEFGCGCGRLLRHWEKQDGQSLHGVDYNADLVSWCSHHLSSVAKFETCGHIPPLSFAEGMFDFVYASSVFTHFDDSQQGPWLQELCRVLKPSGLLLITTMGVTRLQQLSLSERASFREGLLVVKHAKYAGTNICGAFHPKKYVLRKVSPMFRLLEYEPGGAIDHNQDIFLLQKA